MGNEIPNSPENKLNDIIQYWITSAEIADVVNNLNKDPTIWGNLLKEHADDIFSAISMELATVNNNFSIDDLKNYKAILDYIGKTNSSTYKEISNTIKKQEQLQQDTQEKDRNNNSFIDSVKQKLIYNWSAAHIINAQKSVWRDYFKEEILNVGEVDIAKWSDTQKAMFLFDMLCTTKTSMPADKTINSKTTGQSYSYADISKLLNDRMIGSSALPYDVFHEYQKDFSLAKMSSVRKLYLDIFGSGFDGINVYNVAQGDWSSTTWVWGIYNYMRESFDYGENMVSSMRSLKFSDKNKYAELFLIPKWSDIQSDWKWWWTVEFVVGDKRMIFTYDGKWLTTQDQIQWITVTKMWIWYAVKIDKGLASTSISMKTRSGRYSNGSFDEWNLSVASKNCEITAEYENPNVFSVKWWFVLNESYLNEKVDNDIKNFVENLWYALFKAKANRENKEAHLSISVWATSDPERTELKTYSDKVATLTVGIKTLINKKAYELIQSKSPSLDWRNLQNRELNEYWMDMANNWLKENIHEIDEKIIESLDPAYNEWWNKFQYREKHIALIKARYLNILLHMLQDPATLMDMLFSKIKIEPNFTQDLVLKTKFSLI